MLGLNCDVGRLPEALLELAVKTSTGGGGARHNKSTASSQNACLLVRLVTREVRRGPSGLG